jgi:hypothetical protein
MWYQDTRGCRKHVRTVVETIDLETWKIPVAKRRLGILVLPVER